MSHEGHDAQRELEQRALRNVRGLVDQIENSDRLEGRAQKRMLVWIVVVAIGVAIAFALFLTNRPPPSAVIVVPPPPAGAPAR